MPSPNKPRQYTMSERTRWIRSLAPGDELLICVGNSDHRQRVKIDRMTPTYFILRQCPPLDAIPLEAMARRTNGAIVEYIHSPKTEDGSPSVIMPLVNYLEKEPLE